MISDGGSQATAAEKAYEAQNIDSSGTIRGYFYAGKRTFGKRMKKASQTYGREERLKSRKRIELLFREGKRMGIPPLMFIYRFHDGHALSGVQTVQAPANPISDLRNPESGIRNQSSILQAGVGVRSKQFRKAVDRNRIKRLLRECWRTQKNTLRDHLSTGQQNLDVFILYTGTEIPAHADLHQKTGEGIRKLIERYELGNKTRV